VIADEHAGLAAAARKFLPEVPRQRCTVHLQRNVGAKVPHRLRKRVAREAARIFQAPGLAESKKRLAEFRARWHKELPEAVEVLERGFPAATQFYAFPDRASALRLITAVAIRTTTIWGERRYLDLSLLMTPEVSPAA